MTRTTSIACAAALVLLGSGAASAQHDHGSHGTGAAEKLGTVHFETSCAAAAKAPFDRAVALLHSFEFTHAADGFGAVLKADPACAMAEWGIAMSRWGNPFTPSLRPPQALAAGRDAVGRARGLKPKTPREAAYVDAVAALYTDVETRDQRTRIVAYRDAMQKLAAGHPKDTEATIFHALAIAAAAPPQDKSYAELMKAGALLEPLLPAQPEHPGLSHYIIHSYDVPPLADKALAAARRYAKIAPSATHALHMPSHTFTRVGAWQESIDTNVASGDAARRDGAVAAELHALDYRTYAYLQSGQDAEAKKVIDSLPEIKGRFDPAKSGSAAPGSAGVFALAAIPARYALERGDWKAAAALTPEPSQYAFADALTWVAKAIGAGRTANPAVAKEAVEALTKIHATLVDQKETYWAGQAEIQRRTAMAWHAFAEGRPNEALVEMLAAADLEDATEKAAVTPGPLAPARELVGEMLLLMNKHNAALEAYEATLKKEPNRFRALAGAVLSSALAGKPDKAKTYGQQLVDVCAKADAPGRMELVHTRTLLKQLE
jgi:hypothetical protein